MAPKPRRNLVSLDEAAEYLGVSTLTCRRWIASGRIRAYRVGPKFIRVDLDEVDGLLEPIPAAVGA